MATAALKQSDALPSREFILLTEYITWELDGVARTDDEITRLRVELFDHDQKKWGSAYGPGWLKPNLELIRDGKTWPLSEYGNTETDQINSNALQAATRWLARSELQVQDALQVIEQDLICREFEAQAYAELEEFIWSEASAKYIVLFGRQWKDRSRSASPEYEPIGEMFFLRRAKFSCGNGYHGKGELARWPDDNSELGILDSVFDNSDPPVTYVEIKLSRQHAMALSAKFRARHTVESDPETTRLAAAALTRPKWPLNVALATVMSPDLDFVTAIAGREYTGDLCLDLATRLGAFKAFRHREVTIRTETPSDAWFKLRNLVFDDEIAISGNEVDGPRAGGAQIPAVETGTLELDTDKTRTQLQGDGKPWRNIMVNRDALLKHFPLNGELPWTIEPIYDSANIKGRAAERSNLQDTSQRTPQGNGYRQAILTVAEKAYPVGLPNPVRWPAVKERLLPLMIEEGLVLVAANPDVRTFQRALKNWTPKSKLAKG